MKNKRLLFSMFVIMLTLLAACSPAAAINSAPANTVSSIVTSMPVAEQSQETLQVSAPISTEVKDKLAAGSLLLENTDLAITKDQAKTLVLLWKGLENLSSSDTASEVEINAVYQQIQDSMSSQQLAAIEEMEIDPTTLRQTLSEMGLQIGRMGNPSNETGENQDGQMPTGGAEMGLMGGPGGGGGRQGGLEGQPQIQGTPSGEMATAIAERQAAGGFNENTMLIRPLILLLEQRASLES
jgi:hypothetical protein